MAKNNTVVFGMLAAILVTGAVMYFFMGGAVPGNVMNIQPQAQPETQLECSSETSPNLLCI